MSKVQRNNCHDRHCLPSVTGKTSSVSLISHTHAQYIAEWEVPLTYLRSIVGMTSHTLQHKSEAKLDNKNDYGKYLPSETETILAFSEV